MAALFSGVAQAAGIRVVPSSDRVVPGEDFFVDVVADGIPSEGLGGVQFRINFSVAGGSAASVSDLSLADPGEVSIAAPLLMSPPTATRSGIGDFFWNTRGPNGILVIDNETLSNGSGLYTFAHTSGALPPSGSGAIARFVGRVGSRVTAERMEITLSEVMLLDGGPAYTIDYVQGASVTLGCRTTVPLLQGLDLSQATAALAAANLSVGSVSEIDNPGGSRPLNVVLDASPAAGAEVYCQSSVNVSINDAPLEVTEASAVDKLADDTGAVILSWRPSSSADTAGYRVYQGASLLKDVPVPSATGTEIGGLTNAVQTQVRIVAYDRYGNESQGVVVPVTPLDDVPPVVTIASPSPGLLNQRNPRLIYSTNKGTATVRVDGAVFSTLSGEYLDSLADGPHSVRVEVAVGPGNSGFAEAAFTIDATLPVVSATPGGGIYGLPQTVILAASEAATIYYTTDGTPPTKASSIYTGEIPVPATVSLSYFAEDLAGNSSDPMTEQYVIDTLPPALTISTLADGSYTNNETLNIAGTVSDNVGVKDLQMNDVAVPLGADGSFSHAIVLQSGSNEITIYAADLAGNRTTDTRIIHLDQSAPGLVITSPADNAKTASAVMTVSGTVDESSTVVVKHGERAVPVEVVNEGFTTEFTLTPGYNTIEVTATDLAANRSSQKRTVVYDDTKPAVAITEPSQDIRTNSGSMTIRGSASDAFTAVTVTVTIDNRMFTPEVVNGAFEQEVPLTEERSYAVTVTATDEVGASSTVQRNVIYDVTPPVLSIDAVTTPTNQGSQVLAGTMEAGAAVVVTCPTAVVGEVGYPTATTWSATLSGLAPRSNDVAVTATDAAGNLSTAVTQIIYDTIPPTCSIAINGGAALTNSLQVQLGLLSADSHGVALMRLSGDGTNWSEPEPYAETRGWSVAAGEGAKQVSVKFGDNAGNWSAACSAVITLDTIPPVSTPFAGNPVFTSTAGEVFATRNTLLTVTATDNLSGVAGTLVALDNAPWSDYAPFTFAAEGRHAFRYRSFDRAGNEEEVKEFGVTIDNTTPVSSLAAGSPRYKGEDGTIYASTASTFAIAAADALSGMAKTEYRIDGDAWTAYAPFTIDVEGPHLIGFRSIDNLGNAERENVLAVIIDSTPPVSTATVGSPQHTASGNVYVGASTAIALSAIDDASGVGSIRYAIDGGAPATYSGGINLGTFADGNHSVSYRSVDKLGNLEPTANFLAVILDTTPPKTIISGSDPLTEGAVNVVSPETRFTLSATDGGSGVRKTWFRIDGGEWRLYEAPFPLQELEAAAHTISFSSEDNVDNAEPEQSITVRLVVAEVTKEIDCTPAVLVGAWEDQHNSVKKQGALNLLASILSTLPVRYGIAEDEDDFRRALRSGKYTTYLLLDYRDDGMGAELRERVNYGEGLVFIKTTPAADPVLDEVFGMKFAGRSVGDGAVVTLLPGPLWEAATFRSSGKPVAGDVSSQTATVLGTVSDKRGAYPAVIFNNYGEGRSLLYTFDLLSSAERGTTAKLLADSIDLVSPKTRRITAQEAVPVKIVIASSDEPFTASVAEQIPAGTRAEIIAPAGSVTGETVFWQQAIQPQSKTAFTYYLNLPDRKGEYSGATTVRYANAADYRLYGVYPLSLTVDRDSACLIAGITEALQSLPVTDTAETTLVADLLHMLSGVAAVPADEKQAEKSIEAVTRMVKLLRSFKGETGGIRNDLDELLLILERKWYLLGQQP